MTSKEDEEKIPSKNKFEGSEALEIIKKVQKHLIFLEKKIDLIVEGLPSRPTGGAYRSASPARESRPYRPSYTKDKSSTPTGGGYRSGPSKDGEKRPYHKGAKPEYSAKPAYRPDSSSGGFSGKRTFDKSKSPKPWKGKQGIGHKRKKENAARFTKPEKP